MLKHTQTHTADKLNLQTTFMIFKKMTDSLGNYKKID